MVKIATAAATMARLGVGYDVLPHESSILQLGFWQRAFELLEASGAIRLEEEGKNAGCWVMSLADSPEFADMDDPDKIRRSLHLKMATRWRNSLWPQTTATRTRMVKR